MCVKYLNEAAFDKGIRRRSLNRLSNLRRSTELLAARVCRRSFVLLPGCDG